AHSSRITNPDLTHLTYLTCLTHSSVHMKILFPTVLFAACAQPALTCDLCAIYAATEAQGSGSGFFGGVAEQFTHFDTLQEDGHKVSNTIDQHIESSVSQIFAGYNFND